MAHLETLRDLEAFCRERGITYVNFDISGKRCAVSAFERAPRGQYYQAKGETLSEASDICFAKFTSNLTNNEESKIVSQTDLTGLLE